MKRSKMLLASNILGTLYSMYMLWTFGGAVVEAGGADFIEALGTYFKTFFRLFGNKSPTLTLLYVILVLLCIHIIAFVVGCLVGWIAYASKKGGLAKLSASLYLIGTICFPVFFFFGLPITVFGFIGGAKQKKLNTVETA